MFIFDILELFNIRPDIISVSFWRKESVFNTNANDSDDQETSIQRSSWLELYNLRNWIDICDNLLYTFKSFNGHIIS